MLKINLLPKIINEKRAVRATALLFACLLVAVVAGGLAYGMKLRGDVQVMEQQATDAEAAQARVKAIDDGTAQMLSSIVPIQKKLDFIDAVLKYNGEFPALYEQVAKWTYEKVSYDSMQSDGTQVQMQARVKNLDDLGRFLLNMYRATDLFTSVDISGVPGYGVGATSGSEQSSPAFQGGQIGGSMASLAGISAISTSVEKAAPGENWISFTVVCKLKTPIVAPAFGGATGAAGAAGAGGGGAMPSAPMPMGGPGGGPPRSMPMGPMGPGGGPVSHP